MVVVCLDRHCMCGLMLECRSRGRKERGSGPNIITNTQPHNTVDNIFTRQYFTLSIWDKLR